MAKSKAGGRAKRNNVSPSAITYNGPIRSGRMAIPDDGIITRVTGSFATANGGTNGLILAANTIQVKDTPDWANFAATYAEYRVLGMQLHFMPNFPDGNTAVIQGAGVGFTNHNADIPVIVSLQEAVQHANWKPFHSGTEWKGEWKMASVEEADFISTTTPSNTSFGNIYAIAHPATSAGSYGITCITYVVQFRDRR